MTRFCSASGRYALYLECQECDKKGQCRKGVYGKKNKNSKDDTGARSTVQRRKEESTADT